MDLRSWYSIRNRTSGVLEVAIYDEIGVFGITASQFWRDLQSAEQQMGDLAEIRLHINSPGGEVFDALAIYNMLKRHDAVVNVTIDGIAASAASVVAMAGDDIAMPGNAMMMIHNPSGVVIGEASDMREIADALDKVQNGLISAYREKTGLDDDEIRGIMDATTWLSAAEAVEKGFADRLLEPIKIAAKFDLHKLPKVPDTAPRADLQTPSPEPEQPPADPPTTTGDNVVDINAARAEAASEAQKAALEIVNACSDAGFPALSGAFLARRMTAEQVADHLDMIGTLASAADLGGVKARFDELLPRIANGSMTFKAASDDLLSAKAAAGSAPIKSHLIPGVPGQGEAEGTGPRIDRNAIYARHNRKRAG